MPTEVENLMVGHARTSGVVRIAEVSTGGADVVKAIKADVAKRIVASAKSSFDLTWVRFILDTEGPNNNWDYMPRATLASRYETMALKPFNMEHVVKEEASMLYMDKTDPPVINTIYGIMAHPELCWADGTVLTDKEIKDLDRSDNFDRPEKDRLCASVWTALYSFHFPETVEDVIAEATAGRMSVSMERWINKWDFLVVDEDGKRKAMSRQEARDAGVDEAWSERKLVNEHRVYRRSLDCVYGGGASTLRPANLMAGFLPSDDLEDSNASTSEEENEESEKNHEGECNNPPFAAVITSAQIAGDPAQAVSTNSDQENLNMAEQNADKTVTGEDLRKQVRAEVDQALASIGKAQDREKAIADLIDTHATAKASAILAQHEAVARATAAENTNKTLAADVEAAKAELAKANEKVADTAKQLDAARAEVEKTNKVLAEATVRIAQHERTATVATRTAAIAKMDLTDELRTRLTERAQASNDSGLVYSDDQFKGLCDDFADVYKAGKASAKPEGAAASQEDDDDAVPANPDITGGGDLAAAQAAMASGAPAKGSLVSMIGIANE